MSHMHALWEIRYRYSGLDLDLDLGPFGPLSILGILMNSLMSIHSFNNFDFDVMFGKVKDEEKIHKSKFWLQCAFESIVIATNLG